ncbi:thymidine phosphorylase [Bacteroidota bacterium]
MNIIEIIKKKRDGFKLTKKEFEWLIENYINGKVKDYQFSAFLMAAFINNLDTEETVYLTDAMLHSGEVLNLSSVKGLKIDKHSTGGVGDKTSLILVPIVSAAGVNVPMISGRGLEHSGGTLDKLESIPGCRVDLSLREFKKVLKRCGGVFNGQTKEIAPADKLIYPLRDFTGTIESIPLITGSIMSKKLAEGLDGLVLDIKVGNGAFMKDMKNAIKLADSLTYTARAFDKKVIAFITDMNQPLGFYIGNWLEVYETLEILNGKYVEDLLKVTFKLAGAMLYLGGKASSIEEGEEISNEMIRTGKAYKKFLEIIELQNGDIRYIKNPDKYPKSKYHEFVNAEKSGFVYSMNTYKIGTSASKLGAGRFTYEDFLDPKAGIIMKVKIGDYVKKGSVIAEIFTDKMGVVEEVKNNINNTVHLSKEKVNKPRLIKKTIQEYNNSFY